MIVDLFAGPGGWDEGLRLCGRTDVIGLEVDADAIATAEAAGHRRMRNAARRGVDVSAVDPTQLELDGVLATGIVGSPPCGGLSDGGLRKGCDDLQMVADLLDCLVDGEDHRADYLMRFADHRSGLLVEPMRYLIGTHARWLALEQVPAVLPIWEEYAAHLTGAGWFAEFGELNARDFGVPQDRVRAFLVAHRDHPVYLPAPTVEQRVGADVVLGPGVVGFPRRVDRGKGIPIGGVYYRNRDLRDTSLPAFTLTEKARSWKLAPAGQSFEHGRQLTVDEAGRLQGFPSGYPWRGANRTSQFLQVANAVPPPLGAAVCRAALEADALATGATA